MAQRVGVVVVCHGEGKAVGGFLAIADGVVLEAAVAGGDCAVGNNDLAEGIVAPEPARQRWVGSAAGCDSDALADGIHGVVVVGNGGGANFVLLEIEDVAVGFPGVGDRVDGAGDLSGEPDRVLPGGDPRKGGRSNRGKTPLVLPQYPAGAFFRGGGGAGKLTFLVGLPIPPAPRPWRRCLLGGR